jgi:hypothetical protein
MMRRIARDRNETNVFLIEESNAGEQARQRILPNAYDGR